MRYKFLLIAKILFFLIILNSCAPRSYYDQVRAVNSRKELRKEQRAREKNMYYSRNHKSKEEKLVIKERKKEARAEAKALKKARKRHLKWQSDEVRNRIKKNKRKSEREFKKQYN